MRSDKLDFAPNCRYILLDAPHAARRILSRPWKADSLLDDACGLICFWPTSMGQLVQNSHDLKMLFRQCVDETAGEAAVSTRFKNLRAAAHRFESKVTPLSRGVLSLSAYVLFATKLSVLRKGDKAGKAAAYFLDALSVELVVIWAMMADAGSEALNLIRFLDREDLPIADLCKSVSGFLDRITWLFHHDGCLHSNGHVEYVTEWLRKPHFFAQARVPASVSEELQSLPM